MGCRERERERERNRLGRQGSRERGGIGQGYES